MTPRERDDAAEPTAADLVHSWTDPAHRDAAVCPSCRQDLATVGLPEIVSTFEVCTCDPAHEYLREQLWHRRCFAIAENVGFSFETINRALGGL